MLHASEVIGLAYHVQKTSRQHQRVTNGGVEMRNFLPSWTGFVSQPKPRLDNPDRHRNENAYLRGCVQASD